MPDKTAYLSVYNKTGLADFAAGLEALGFDIYASGSTYKFLKQAGIDAAAKAANILLKERDLDIKEDTAAANAAEGAAKIALGAKQGQHKTVINAASAILKHHAATGKTRRSE